MEPPNTKKGAQRLTGRLASLNRFISRSAERNLPFFEVLKSAEVFQWGSAQQKAFEELKQYLIDLTTLTPPTPGAPLLLYVATWYAMLPLNSILSWGDLEQKLHEHFFSGDYELDLVDLVALRQEKDESVSDYIQRFRDTRNRCFQIHLTDKQLAGIAFDGLRYLSAFRDQGIPGPTSECRRVPQPR